MNIILVVSDTFRRDHLPSYGNDKIKAPNLSNFAETGLIFNNCYAASFPTVPARADLLTGRYTFTQFDWGPLPKNLKPLAQYLSEAGYLTSAVADVPFLIRNGYGYDRGFDNFIWIRGQGQGLENDDVLLQRQWEEDYFAPRTFRTAIKWLERHRDEGQFFLYIDTWDPHEPWDPPEYYTRLYEPEYQGEHIAPCYWEWKELDYSARDLEIAHACYCGEITMVDRWFGLLMDRLDTLGLRSRTAVIFLSDHGFYFGEHGLFGKSRFRWADDVPFKDGWDIPGLRGYRYRSPLHNELTQVPLLMHIPGVASKRVEGLVSIPDIMPTVLELAGVEVPLVVQAHSLLPLLQGKTEAVQDIIVTSTYLETEGSKTKIVDDLAREVSELSPSSITNGEWDLLYSVCDGPVELYRLGNDPGHKRNLISQNRDIAEELHAKFVSFLEEKGTKDELIKPRREI